MTFTEVLDEIQPDLEALEERLRSLQRPSIPMSSEIMDYVLSMCGKRVRPILLMLTARVGEPRDREALLWASVVVELIHTATLLHDDCIDEGVLRRGFPTVNHRWGPQAALLMGDYLFTKGFEILSQRRLDRALGILSRHTHKMTRGMNRELASRYDPRIGEEEYLRIAEEKTGSLFMASCEIGAEVGNIPPESAELLSSFARTVGIAFQIVDDVLDFAADPAETGSPLGNDFRLGFATLPLIYALKDGDPSAAAEVAESFRQREITESSWERARDLVISSGAVEASRRRAGVFAQAARDHLSSLAGSNGLGPLYSIADFVVSRRR